MGPAQYVVGYPLALGLFLLAAFYARRQVLVLRRLRQTQYLPDEETRRERRQSYRRLASSFLLFLIAVLLGIALLWFEPPAQRLAELADAKDLPRTDPERTFLRYYSALWIAILLLLLGVVLLAAFDLWAIRRYGLRQRRKLNDDRRAMIARQAKRLHRERDPE